MDVADDELQGLYTWVDEIPLTRPKRNIARDFSDGVLMAEIVHHYFPKLVELHNYSPANGAQQKLYNWSTLNQKVFKRLGFTVSKPDCEAIVNCGNGAIERVLKLVKVKLAKFVDVDTEGGEAGSQPATLTYKELPANIQPTNQHFLQPSLTPFSKGSTQNQAFGLQDQATQELKETNEILETKVRKLEQLVKLKEAKIQTLMAKLQAAGLA